MRRYTIAAIPLILLVSCAIQLACQSGGGVLIPQPNYDASYPPRNFQWSVGSERINLSWDPVPFADGYRVYISTDGVNFVLHSGATLVQSPSIIVADVQNGKVYYLAATAVGSTGKETVKAYPGGAPNAVPLTPTSVAPPEYVGVPPAAPKNLQGYAGDKFIHLEWDPNTEPDFMDYLVWYRALSNTAFVMFPNPQVSTFKDWGDAQNGIEFFFKINARDEEELISLDSNVVHLTPKSAPPAAPTDVTALYSPGEGGVVLNWAKSTIETDVARFRVIRYDVSDPIIDPLIDTVILTLDYPVTKDPYDPTGQGTLNIPPFTDRFAEHGHTYRYEIAAIDSDGQIGPPSLPPDVALPA